MIVIAVAAAAALFIWRLVVVGREVKKIHRDLDGLGIPKHKAKFKYSTRTFDGVKVISTVPVPEEAIREIDEGISILFDHQDARRPEWDKMRDPAEFTVLFIEPHGVNVETEPGAPHLSVGGVTTAGTNIGAAPNQACDRPYLVLPHQKDQEWRFLEYLRNSVFYEGEHVREWANDPAVWARFVGAGDSHPHEI